MTVVNFSSVSDIRLFIYSPFLHIFAHMYLIFARMYLFQTHMYANVLVISFVLKRFQKIHMALIVYIIVPVVLLMIWNTYIFSIIQCAVFRNAYRFRH